jgi:hypothetical protein
MVLFEIDDERIKKLAVNTLKRAFIGEFKNIHEKLSGKSLESAADTLFAFYIQYIAHVHLEDKLDPRTPGRILTHTHVEDEGPRPVRGEILLFLPVSMRDKFTDNEIIGVIAHELGHLFTEFHYTTPYDVGIGDMRPIEVEWSADEAARLLGFEKEIRAMRAKIPLPEERPPSFNISIHGTHGSSTGA